MIIAIGGSRKEKHWINRELTWEDFMFRAQSTIRTPENMDEYKNLPKLKQDDIKDVGGFVGGELKDGKRKNGYVLSRSLLTLDMDHAPEGICQNQLRELPYCACIYSTHKHTAAEPRLRLIIPLSREVTEDEYPAVSRMVAKDIGMEYFDDTTYEPARLMYWPSTSMDAEFVFEEINGPMLDPDEYLDKYANWRDITEWPVSYRQTEIQKRSLEKQADPLSKEGVVGAFCRVYSIEDAIYEYLSDVYEESAVPGRFDYIAADSAAGVVLYDGKFAFSHHASDPAAGKLLNAFDLVRVHRFGQMEEKAAFQAMAALAIKNPQIKIQLSEEKKAEAKAEFGQDEAPVDPFPYIVPGKNGGVMVSPPRLAKYFRDNNHYYLTKGQSGGVQFWLYVDGIYVHQTEREIKGIIMQYVEKYSMDLIKIRDAAEVYNQLSSDRAVRHYTEVNSDEEVVVLENGLYNLTTGKLAPHTPKHYGTIKLPVAWNPNAKKPEVFNRFLHDFTGGDLEQQQFIKEFFGIAMSNVKGYRTKTALFIVGAGNTGKSQLRGVLENIIGADYCASTDLSALEHRFGLSQVFGKRLVGSNDMAYVEIPELKAFKMLTGGDNIVMEYKFLDAFSTKYDGLLWFSMNDLPRFGGDRGKHVFDRMVIIQCGEPCPMAKQDKHLLDKMIVEREGIVKECLEAAAEVLKNGCNFTKPNSSHEAIRKYEIELSSSKTFINEHCVKADTKQEGTRCAELYRYYKEWALTNGYRPVSAKLFTREGAEAIGVAPENFKIRRSDNDYYPLKLNKAALSEFGLLEG